MPRTASLLTINDRIADEVSPHMTLERGEGYIYLIYDDEGPAYETKSIMVPYLNVYSTAEWVQQAAEWLEELETPK